MQSNLFKTPGCSVAAIFFGAWALSSTLSQETAGKVDFRKDVQPLFNQYKQQSHHEAGRRPPSRAATRRRVGSTLFPGERRLCNGTVTGGIETGGRRQDERPVLRARVKFLLKTQLEDGSWYVKSRAIPFQPYSESGFPHGRDQWISAAATNWASMALALSSRTTRRGEKVLKAAVS